jgi:hypothetical protein
MKIGLFYRVVQNSLRDPSISARNRSTADNFPLYDFGFWFIWLHFSIRFSQVHDESCADNSLRLSFYECRSWCNSRQWFDISFFATSRISRLLRNLRKVTDSTRCVSEPYKNWRDGFAPGKRMSKTMRDRQDLLNRTLAMLFFLSWKRIHTLHLEISARLSSLQKQQFSSYWPTLGWSSIRHVGSRTDFQSSKRPIEWVFRKRCHKRWTAWTEVAQIPDNGRRNVDLLG